MSIENFNDTMVVKYVKALYEVSIGRELEFLEQVRAVRKAMESLKNRESLFKRFSLLPKEGGTFVDTLISELELLQEVGNFLKVVLNNKRFSEILDICSAYEKFFDQMNGKKIFYITYAKSFPKQTKAELSKHLQELFDGKVDFVARKDASLIDGFQIRYGSKILDYSMKSKLNRLKKSMKGEIRI